MTLLYYISPRDSCIFFGYVRRTSEKGVESGDYVLHLDFLTNGSTNDKESNPTALYLKSCFDNV